MCIWGSEPPPGPNLLQLCSVNVTSAAQRHLLHSTVDNVKVKTNSQTSGAGGGDVQVGDCSWKVEAGVEERTLRWTYISVFRLRSWTGSKHRRRFLDQMVSWLLVWGGRKSGQKTKKFKLKNVMKLSTFGKPLDILYHFLVVSFCYCRWDIFATFLSINSYQCGNCQLSLSNFLRSRIFFLILSQNNQTAGHKMLIKVNCLAKKLKS